MDIRRVCDVARFPQKGDTYAWIYSITREADGRFSDADLAKILQDATHASAADFGARGTPEVLRVIELLSIEQGRKWGVCTVSILRFVPFVSLRLVPLFKLNEFRKFIGLDRELLASRYASSQD
jgi:hypothetical protein